MIRRFFARLFPSLVSSVKGGGSAFAQLAQHEAAVLEQKGKLIALDAAHAAKEAVLTEIEKGIDAAHQRSAEIAARIEANNARL